MDTPALVLYGARDEIVPPAPVKEMAGTLNGVKRLALYADGWHMLLRDCQAETVWRDVATWIADAAAPLPSAAQPDSPTALNTSARRPVADACARA